MIEAQLELTRSNGRSGLEVLTGAEVAELERINKGQYILLGEAVYEKALEKFGGDLSRNEIKQLIKRAILRNEERGVKVSQKELADQFSVDQSTVSRCHKELEHAGASSRPTTEFKALRNFCERLLEGHDGSISPGVIADEIEKQVGKRVDRSTVSMWRRTWLEEHNINPQEVIRSDGRSLSVVSGPLYVESLPTRYALLSPEVVEKRNELAQVSGDLIGEHPIIAVRKQLAGKAGARGTFDHAIDAIADGLLENPLDRIDWWNHGYDYAALVKDWLYTKSNLAKTTAANYYAAYLRIPKMNRREGRIEQDELDRIVEDLPVDRHKSTKTPPIAIADWKKVYDLLLEEGCLMRIAMFTCCFPLGMRTMQIAQLRVRDVNLEDGRLNIAGMKKIAGFSKDLLAFPIGSVDIFRAYLKVRERELAGGQTDSLFARHMRSGGKSPDKRSYRHKSHVHLWDHPIYGSESTKDKSRGSGLVGQSIKYCLTKAGIDYGSPHSGRVSASNQLRLSGWDQTERVNLLGWTNTEMVNHYDRINSDEIRQKALGKPVESEWEDIFAPVVAVLHKLGG